MRNLLSVVLLLALSVTQSHANDTLATLGAGGLIPLKTTSIVMESEDLVISPHQIRIRYVFRNTSPEEIRAVVAFPLPDLGGGLIYGTPIQIPAEKQLNFVDFAVAADGQPVAVNMEARAFDQHGNDISTRLKSDNLPINVLLGPVTEDVNRLSPAERSALESEELLIREESEGADKKPRLNWYPWWTTRVQYYWNQSFPANSTVELVQTYKPVVGGSYITKDNDGSTSLEDYCGTPATLERIAIGKQKHPQKEGFDAVWLERRIDYILTTANNWKGPIGRFHLTVTTDSPEDILVTCYPGLKQVTPTRYGATHTDYRPDTELKVLILQAAQ